MNYVLIGIGLLVAVIGCRRADVIPTTTSASTGSTGTSGFGQTTTFAASDWRFFLSTPDQSNPNQSESSLAVSRVVSTSSTMTLPSTGVSSYSLSISTTAIKNTDVFSYWVATIPPPRGLLAGKSLTLKAKIQLQNVQGQGVSIALRGDRKTQMGVLFVSTQGQTTLTGTTEFTDYSVTLPYTTSVDYIDAYLVFLPQTTGKVIFNEVSVQVN